MQQYSEEAVDKLFTKYINGGRNLPQKSFWNRKTQFKKEVEIIEFEEKNLDKENVLDEPQKDSSDTSEGEDRK